MNFLDGKTDLIFAAHLTRKFQRRYSHQPMHQSNGTAFAYSTALNCLALINSTPKQPLDSTEAAGLAYMREEEKLAHDVYAALQAKWGMRALNNIYQSESRHFSAIKLLLDRYELPDPAANQAAGVFQNEALQTLYSNFVREGENSLNGAMRVGATIEDLNIRNLENAAAATDNSDLKLVYHNLIQSSQNHLRAFVRQLAAAGESYAPQYISPAALGGRGNGRGPGRGNNGICPWR